MAISILVPSACVGTSIRMKRVRDHYKLLNSGPVKCLTLCELRFMVSYNVLKNNLDLHGFQKRESIENSEYYQEIPQSQSADKPVAS